MTHASKGITTIQVTPSTRDRLYRMKFRKTYDQLLVELCDYYEAAGQNAQK
ncbi:MAG TPA: hypothetical protein VFA17_02265 [Thermoplasmata archaeon]|jgi:hypothetical protein|nr:hypothetical protein [Thermoplasmata archaeon]